MATIRAHIVLPAQLARDIDALVGPRGRSAFLVETAEKEVRRQKLQDFLNSDEPGWKDEDHPDIVEVGTAAWVHNLRHTLSPRQQRLEELARDGEA